MHCSTRNLWYCIIHKQSSSNRQWLKTIYGLFVTIMRTIWRHHYLQFYDPILFDAYRRVYRHIRTELTKLSNLRQLSSYWPRCLLMDVHLYIRCLLVFLCKLFWLLMSVVLYVHRTAYQIAKLICRIWVFVYRILCNIFQISYVFLLLMKVWIFWFGYQLQDG